MVDFEIVVTENIVDVAENGGDQTVEAVGQAERLRIAFEFRVVSISHIRVDSAIY